MGVVEDVRRQLGIVKEKVLEKLVAASVPADTLESARQYLENIVKEVSVAAHGLTVDALSRIKSRLVDILPSLSPSQTTKMVDEAAKEANEEEEVEEEDEEEEKKSNQQASSKASFMSPASSVFASLKLLPRL